MVKIRNRLLIALAVVAGLALAGLYCFGLQPVGASPTEVYSNIAAPSNGTANSLNLTFLAQEWIGFYGNLTMEIVQSGSAHITIRF